MKAISDGDTISVWSRLNFSGYSAAVGAGVAGVLVCDRRTVLDIPFEETLKGVDDALLRLDGVNLFRSAFHSCS